MALREAIQRAAPGLFIQRALPPVTDENPLTRLEEDALPKVRAATFSLYGGTGFGTPIIVPNLDHPSPAALPASEEMKGNPLLFAPIWRLSMRIGSLPIKVYRFTSTTGRPRREEASDHPAYQLLRAPNPDLTRNLVMGGTVATMFTHGRCGWFKERRDPFGPRLPSNPIVALWPIPGNVLFPLRTPKRLIAGFELRTFGEAPVRLPAADVVFHRLMPDVNDWGNQTTPTAPLGDILEFSGSGLSAMTKLFRSALLQRLYMDLHGADIEPTVLERLHAELESAARNPYAVPVMEGGATLETMGEGPNHELLKASMDMAQEIIRYTFGFPEDKDNLQHFYGEVVQPVADAMEQEMERSLMPDFAEAAFPQFQFREILAGSPLERAQLHQTKILSGQETPDEARDAEDMPPVPGGNVAFVPLNMIPLTAAPEDRNPRKKDTGDGLGGSQGKGTIPRIAAGQRVRQEDGDDNTTPATDRWRTVRERVLTAQAPALERRLRGALNDERDGLRSLMAPLGQVPSRTKLETGTFKAEEVSGVFARTDANIRGLLDRFMANTVTQAASVAASMFRSPDELLQSVVVDDTVFQVIRARVESMTDHFANRRIDRFDTLVEGEINDGRTMRHADDAIRAEWNALADHLVRMIGETETKWAFERGAAHGWEQSDVQELAIVKEGDHCSSGMCSDVVAQGHFRISDVPTPLHPGCKCMAVPARMVE